MPLEHTYTPVPPHFFEQEDTLWLARWLLGKLLITRQEGLLTAVRITETEAYLGATDRACHAYGYRHTARTRTMYLPGGHAYVYLCYGMHHLFNIVTHRAGEPHAILLRAGEPAIGTALMQQRRGPQVPLHKLASGPGSLSKALGIHTGLNALPLAAPHFEIAEDAAPYLPDTAIGSSPRIGVSYAGTDALLPYRFFVKNHPTVSGPKTWGT
jgi:DNA-3-methyladenine glycosylase